MAYEWADIAIVGGGAAGIFAAIQARALAPRCRVVVLEAGARPLQKVRISGGGRCNVTHACFELSRLVSHYPRGSRELRKLLARFGPADTMRWFQERGVALKTEADGRVFPQSDSSQTIIDCLLGECQRRDVEILTGWQVQQMRRHGQGFFELEGRKETLRAGQVLLATGGSPTSHAWLEAFGHRVIPTVPSLFTFTLSHEHRAFCELAGVSLAQAGVSLELKGVQGQEGPLLFTHWGLSGPAVLRLSAFAARELAEQNYRARVRLDFLPGLNQEEVRQQLLEHKLAHRRRSLAQHAPFPLPKRLWAQMVSGMCEPDSQRTWGECSDRALGALAERLKRLPLDMVAKGVFKEEFVVAGGVALKELALERLESRLVEGLYVAGELLDVDGVTGGFNFQNAWASGWIAGQAMARRALEVSGKERR